MTYQLKKTNGSILTTIIDGQIDRDSTNLVFIGRNFRGFGELLNENFVKLLENFANPDAPQRPIDGQLWWDNSTDRLKVYDGDNWISVGGSYVQPTTPSMNIGDFWLDSENRQLYSFDGVDIFLVGPEYNRFQGLMGVRGETIQDRQGQIRHVGGLYINNNRVGIVSNDDFEPAPSQAISALVSTENPTGRILKGFNIIDRTNFVFRGTASNALALRDLQGNTLLPSQFYRKEFDETVSGTLFIQNNGGLKVGGQGNVEIKVSGDNVLLDSTLVDQDIRVRVTSSSAGNSIIDAIHIDAETKKIGIFKNPEYTLDVNGDLRVIGDLIVQGTTSSIEVSTLIVEDRNIELGKTTSGAVGDDDVADQGGITLSSIDGDKSWVWDKPSNAWTSNVNINLDNQNSVYKINGQDKLTNTELKNVLHADDLRTIGTLDFLNVQSLNIENSIISSPDLIKIASGTKLVFESAQDIELETKVKIKNVALPTGGDDVSTKSYVDNTVALDPLIMSFDITGLGSGTTLYSNISNYLNDLLQPSLANNGKIAKIHATRYSSTSVTNIPVEPFKNVSYISVDSGGTQNESVVQDFEIAPLTAGTTSIDAPQRSMITFVSDGVSWNFVNTLNY
jgi:hypothetical protein